jgi:hypothetical protein
VFERGERRQRGCHTGDRMTRCEVSTYCVSFRVNSMCDLRISKMCPNVKGRHRTQHQVEHNLTGLSTFTGVRKTIYIRISFVRLHLAVLSVISKKQEGFYFRYRHCKKEFVKNRCQFSSTETSERKRKEPCLIERAANKTIRTASSSTYVDSVTSNYFLSKYNCFVVT